MFAQRRLRGVGFRIVLGLVLVLLVVNVVQNARAANRAPLAAMRHMLGLPPGPLAPHIWRIPPDASACGRGAGNGV